MAGFTFNADVRRMLNRLEVIRQRWTADSLVKIGEFGAAQILADSSQSFRRQADPTTGDAWKPSQRALGVYVAAYRKFLAGNRKRSPQRGTTLVDTGRLRASVRSGYELGALGRLIAWGGVTPLVYAAIHQFGGDAGRHHATHLPARPYIGLSPERVEAIRAFALKTMAEDAA